MPQGKFFLLVPEVVDFADNKTLNFHMDVNYCKLLSLVLIINSAII